MSKRPCAHIHIDGRQCGSPAVRNDEFCYWHTEFRRQQRDLDDEARRPPEFIAPGFDSRTGEFREMYPVHPKNIWNHRGVIRKPLELKLGTLENADAVQVAISRVLTALASGRLENRRASTLLYGLQLAAANCRFVGAAATAEVCAPASRLESEPEILPSYHLPEGIRFEEETETDLCTNSPGSGF